MDFSPKLILRMTIMAGFLYLQGNARPLTNHDHGGTEISKGHILGQRVARENSGSAGLEKTSNAKVLYNSVRQLSRGQQGGSALKRNIRSTDPVQRQGRQGIGLGLAGGGFTPQQYQILLRQQQEAMAMSLLQQQMLSSTFQNQRYNQISQGQRPYRRYEEYDDDDSESDEDDDGFDSEEFMSYPIRMGFMPPIPGFPGK